MSATVLLAVLGAAVLHATWNAVIKGRGGGPFAASVGLAVAWSLLGLPLLALVPPLPAAAWPYVLGSVAVHLVYFSLLAWAYERGDLSYVYPIARGVPPVLVASVSGVLLGEALPPLAVVGVLTIAVGVLALGPTGGAVPQRSLLVHALGIAACTAVYTILDGRGMRTGASAASYIVHLLALQGTAFAAGAILLRPTVARVVWEHRITALGTGLLAALGYGIALWAFSQAPIALVAALRETAVLFAALIGWRVLGEPMGPRRMVAAALVTCGAALARLAV